ncbi:MAG: thiamine pyrophosphate-dependent enzyme [Rhodobacteraceae bacterium]|nr:thiamine pyrophosphate-dependent enzyme [Paracoccaceae bacterium]
MSQRPLGAQISHMLKARGVDVIFGIPGVHNVEMYRGIEEAGITHVLARHEQGAGFMADGYARASGRPGVCYVITGPGLCNAMTPLGQAYSDSVPVLALSSCLDETAITRGQLHQMRDQQVAAATVCEWSEEARTPKAAYGLIDRALTEWQSGRARPKHIQVPINDLAALAEAAPQASPAARMPVVSDADLRTVCDRVLSARKPLFIFGGGSVGAADCVPRLLEATGAAAFMTYAGRGVVPAEHPMSFGSYLARPDSVQIMQDADLVVAFGTELSEVDLWRPELGHDCPMIRVDIDTEVLGNLRASDMAVVGDAGGMIRAMNIALAARVDDRKPLWDRAMIAKTRARWRADLQSERPGILPVCDALQEVLPEDAMIYSDMTSFAYAAKEIWDMARAGHWHHPYGFGTLGYALPAAIGGAVARPSLPTIAIAGDYGFQYTVQELGTAVELGLGLPILLWDNAKLAEIEDAMVRSQIAPNAVVAQNPDFLALARAYGAHATEPKDLKALQQAVVDALAASVPTVIRMTPALSAK